VQLFLINALYSVAVLMWHTQLNSHCIPLESQLNCCRYCPADIRAVAVIPVLLSNLHSLQLIRKPCGVNVCKLKVMK